MKNINVPSQVTTVEDKIVGDFTLVQLSLLVVGVFSDFFVYSALPRNMHLTIYKFVLIFVLTTLFFTSAIKINGKIVFAWFITLASYKARCRLYVFNKNSNYLRFEQNKKINEKEEADAHIVTKAPIKTYTAETLSRLDSLNLSFKQEKKGKFHVYITEK